MALPDEAKIVKILIPSRSFAETVSEYVRTKAKCPSYRLGQALCSLLNEHNIPDIKGLWELEGTSARDLFFECCELDFHSHE